MYDIYTLSKLGYAEKALMDKRLYETILRHRMEFNKIADVNYNLHNPKTINPIPPENVIGLWEKDFKKMREEMIYDENKPTFSEIIISIKNLKEKINNLEWIVIE